MNFLFPDLVLEKNSWTVLKSLIYRKYGMSLFQFDHLFFIKLNGIFLVSIGEPLH